MKSSKLIGLIITMVAVLGLVSILIIVQNKNNSVEEHATQTIVNTNENKQELTSDEVLGEEIETLPTANPEIESEIEVENFGNLYDEFINGNIQTSEGKYISDYLNACYYFIQSKNAENMALVVSYENEASVSNDILYEENGELILKASFGRRALGGTSLVDETYICFDSCFMDCDSDIETCEYFEIQQLDSDYNLEDVILFMNRAEGCTMPHNEWRVYEENTGYANVDDYLFNAKKADISISYYDAPDKAVDVRQ